MAKKKTSAKSQHGWAVYFIGDDTQENPAFCNWNRYGYYEIYAKKWQAQGSLKERLESYKVSHPEAKTWFKIIKILLPKVNLLVI
jgi:hypothetical protein